MWRSKNLTTLLVQAKWFRFLFPRRRVFFLPDKGRGRDGSCFLDRSAWRFSFSLTLSFSLLLFFLFRTLYLAIKISPLRYFILNKDTSRSSDFVAQQTWGSADSDTVAVRITKGITSRQNSFQVIAICVSRENEIPASSPAFLKFLAVLIVIIFIVMFSHDQLSQMKKKSAISQLHKYYISNNAYSSANIRARAIKRISSCGRVMCNIRPRIRDFVSARVTHLFTATIKNVRDRCNVQSASAPNNVPRRSLRNNTDIRTHAVPLKRRKDNIPRREDRLSEPTLLSGRLYRKVPLSIVLDLYSNSTSEYSLAQSFFDI